ncbi:glycosyltransferase family 39 protein [Caproicibacterium sp. NSD3]
MLTSWKNFFFVSLDPGGWVTVDKPPISLWVQAVSAKIFGFYGWSILLPECLAAVATVAIIYHIVKRHFGNVAGLVSALVLALSPIFIVVSKTNNTDSVLIFFMTLAAWAMMVAADKGQLRWLLLSAVFLGIAYNAKTLEAFLILPALYAVYFFASTRKWRTRICHLAVATLVLIVVSLSWSVIVDLTPASERPYVDNSTTNSELELALGYNGIQRIIGQSKGGRIQGNSSDFTPQFGNTEGFEAPDSDSANAPNADDSNPSQIPEDDQAADNSGDTTTSTTQPAVSAEDKSLHNSRDGSNLDDSDTKGNLFDHRDDGNMGGSTGNSMFNGGGSAGVLRMFNTTLGGQDSWLLPFGLFSVFALFAGMRKSVETDAEVRRKRRANVLLWGGSVVTMFTYFSIAQFFHPYYISAMAPFLAALVGIGLTEMWRLYKTKGFAGFLLPLALVATGAVQILMLRSYPSYSGVLIPIVSIVTGIPALLLLVWKLLHRNTAGKLATVCVVLGITGLLVAPAVWTGYSVFSGNINSSIPTAGPSAEKSGAFGQAGGQQLGKEKSRIGDSSSSETALIDFLESNNTGEKFLVAVPSASEAEPIILATGKPVMAIGGFSGNDNTLTVAKLQQMVEQGKLKYFLVGGKGGMGNSSNEVTKWVEENGTAVDSNEWSNSSSSSAVKITEKSDTSETLYDLSSYKDK